MTTPIAFIGLGIMGEPMAGHLLAAGYPLHVFTRTRARAEGLLAKGAKWAQSPAAAARAAEVVFLCVPDTPDVQGIIDGPDGLLAAARAGMVIVDHSTISPSATKEFAEQFAGIGAHWLDAPVSGGDAGARNATLSIMVGGEATALDKVRPMLAKMGKTITHCGPSGSGQLTKLVNQILVAGTNLAVCEALTFAKANGLDPATTLSAVGGGAGSSWQLLNLWPKMAAADWAPGFKISLQQKDLRLAIAAAKERGLSLGALGAVHWIFDKALADGAGEQGTQALFRYVEEGTRKAK
jgi:3-hydroxyisobutyrate dehydrogenase